jgi:hypothetical protein
VTALAERLRELAEAEPKVPRCELRTWADYAVRCYHAGRESAFREAARIAEAAQEIEARP